MMMDRSRTKKDSNSKNTKPEETKESTIRIPGETKTVKNNNEKGKKNKQRRIQISQQRRQTMTRKQRRQEAERKADYP